LGVFVKKLFEVFLQLTFQVGSALAYSQNDAIPVDEYIKRNGVDFITLSCDGFHTLEIANMRIPLQCVLLDGGKPVIPVLVQ
jgi:hypothetical protein